MQTKAIYWKQLELLVLHQLTTEMHCNGSRPTQDHIKRQHSEKKGNKETFKKNIYV